MTDNRTTERVDHPPRVREAIDELMREKDAIENRTTELLPCPFCGGEAEVIEADYGMYMTGYAVYCRKCCLKLGVTGRLGETYEWSPIFDTEAEAIAAWNTRATHGTLTAEQVREAIEANSWVETRTLREFNDSSWQAIADELNARAERTCRDASVDSSTQFYCSLCECTVDIPLLWGEVNYCPNCGRKVERGDA